MDKVKQIANKWQLQRYRTPNEIGGMDNQEFYNGMIDDIFEFAKQDAIGFAEWIKVSAWSYSASLIKDSVWRLTGNFLLLNPTVENKNYTTEEIYSLYLLTQQK